MTTIDAMCTMLDLDPLAAGLQIIDAKNLAALALHEVSGKIIPTVPLLIVQLSDQQTAHQVRRALAECYPPDWPIKLLPINDAPEVVPVMNGVIQDLDRDLLMTYPSALVVPPMDELSAQRLPETLRTIVTRLRRDPDGCPWDREQTHQSLRRYLLEETYEVIETLDDNDLDKLAEELGDLLLQVYLHAEIARQEGHFSLGDVLEHINAKLIRRHPHVFGDIQVSSAGQVVQNWEAIKKRERAQAGNANEQEHLLDRVPLASPALIVSREYQKRASKVGFDYPDLQSVLAKIAEEMEEILQATTPEQLHEEIGDFLFIVTRWADWLKIDAEEALRCANRKFRRRFQAMEDFAHQQGRELTSLNTEEWEDFWKRAKASQGV